MCSPMGPMETVKLPKLLRDSVESEEKATFLVRQEEDEENENYTTGRKLLLTLIGRAPSRPRAPGLISAGEI